MKAEEFDKTLDDNEEHNANLFDCSTPLTDELTGLLKDTKTNENDFGDYLEKKYLQEENDH